MKNILSVAMATLFLIIVSCSSEENDYTIDQAESVDLASDVYQDSNVGVYNGVITTLNGEQRGSVTIIIPAENSRSAHATIKLSSGQIISLLTNDVIIKDFPVSNITFGSQATTLTFSVDANGRNPIVQEASLNNLEADIVVRKHTNRAPVVPISGTYACTDCTGHPVLGTGATQTFNLLMFTTPGGLSTFDTQVTLGMSSYDGTGMQGNCSINENETSCDLSGSFSVPGGPITWTGTHTFNNEASGDQDCSGASGTWSFASTVFGTLTGTFVSDDSCPPDTFTFIQDFDGTTPIWNASPSIPFFTADGDAYSPLALNSGFPGIENITNPLFVGEFLFVTDLDSPMGVAEEAILTFDNVAVNAANSSTITFDYDVVGYDGGDDVSYIVVIDGVDQPTVLLVDGMNGGGVTTQGTETINIAAGPSQIGFKLIVEQNGSDFAGFDNIRIVNQ